jgi:hypothetical protein
MNKCHAVYESRPCSVIITLGKGLKDTKASSKGFCLSDLNQGV